ncbi:beta-ketoacyl-ACP synthase II [Fulvivirgaceae bacterium BMA10]|uniref:3-oxoacyl-[acyl-carrier-protein] synthase 2 n=1 Tax=Splendidivirga corallicola TaxID=3051826 RepID=A0ABT8KIP4_9BACT|nr:beta-ketoacyl-ACP synthase II [Fulvivirgaceae bacterium BMA10]
MKQRRVVVTGLGALTPIGNTVETFWKNLVKGVSGANKITRFDCCNFKTDFACELKDYDVFDHFDRKEGRKLDRYSQYALVSTKEAVQNAQISFDQLDKDRCGVIWSSGIGGFETFETQLEDFFKNDKTSKFNPFFIPKILADSAAGLISIKYGFRGVNYCPVSACASSTTALIEAFNYIKWDKADLVIAGGSEAPITQASIAGFNAMKALSTQNDNYQNASRPFDKDRDGFVAGEGGAALVVEEMEHAVNRGTHIYAEIVGGGLSADAYHITGTHPEGLGALLSMKHALNEANLKPEGIDYINAHATSTGLGDISEVKAFNTLFNGKFDNVHISATKSMTGHLLGAAGAIEAVALVKSIETNEVPPTINSIEKDEQIPEDIDLTFGTSVSKTINVGLSNTFGFGGHNASIVMKKP